MVEARDICARYGAAFSPPEANSILGVSRNLRSTLLPVNGLRHPPESGTNGWYLWCGTDFPDDTGFVALHYSHIGDWNGLALKYLALPPGWRFLTDGVYEDVWFDEALLSLR